jgi:microcystin-dependent protein
MAEPFLSEIRILSFAYAPRGWALCNGQLLPINQNTALFSLLGTTYGGNGVTNFALPDLRGRSPVHAGDGITLGERGGEEAHTLNVNEMPPHQHRMRASADLASSDIPAGALTAAKRRGGLDIYGPAGTANVALHPAVMSGAGGSQPHLNMQPFLTLNFVIALQGIYPSRD